VKENAIEFLVEAQDIDVLLDSIDEVAVAEGCIDPFANCAWRIGLLGCHSVTKKNAGKKVFAICTHQWFKIKPEYGMDNEKLVMLIHYLLPEEEALCCYIEQWNKPHRYRIVKQTHKIGECSYLKYYLE